MLFHELVCEHEPWSPMIVLVFLITLFDDLESGVQRNTARIVLKLITVFPRSRPGENQATDFFRIVERDPLGDPSPHGMAHDMGASNAESIHQSDAVFGKELGCIRNIRLVASDQSPMVVDQHLIMFGQLRQMRYARGLAAYSCARDDVTV